MAGPVDPALRALWSLGGAPGSTMRALERAGGELERFEPKVEEAEQIAQAAVAPLLSSPQAAGAKVLERVLARQEGAAPPVAEAPLDPQAPVPASPRPGGARSSPSVT